MLFISHIKAVISLRAEAGGGTLAPPRGGIKQRLN